MLLIQENLFSLTVPLSEEAFLVAPKPVSFFITCLFLLILMFMSLIMTLHPQRFIFMVKSVFAKQRLSQRFRDDDTINEQLYIFLIIIACPIEALAFCCIINYLQIPAFENFTLEGKFYIGLGFFALYHALYVLMIRFSNWLFNYQNFIKRYIFNYTIHHFVASICLYPFLALTCYNSKINLSILMLAIWLCFYITLIIKQLYLYAKNIGLFRFFLYFCTTEILPVLIIGKLYFILGK